MNPFAASLLADDPTPSPTDTAAAQSFTIFGLDPLMLGLIVLLVIMVFFMWRNSRKRKADAAKLAETMRPGVEVMTNFGMFGTIKSLDPVGNTAEIEIAPGVAIKVHRQTLVKTVDQGVAGAPGAPRSVEEAMQMADAEQKAREAAAAEPAAVVSDEAPKFGERIADADKATGDDDKKS